MDYEHRRQLEEVAADSGRDANERNAAAELLAEADQAAAELLAEADQAAAPADLDPPGFEAIPAGVVPQ